VSFYLNGKIESKTPDCQLKTTDCLCLRPDCLLNGNTVDSQGAALATLCLLSDSRETCNLLS
jgi:hypothetical protein